VPGADAAARLRDGSGRCADSGASHVTLTGDVEWLYQKESAERAVRHIRGVRGVLNHITVAPKAVVRDVRHRIVKALHQNADVDARHITATVAGNTATLTGTVGT
jgi:osmotically-inducible protein OsmY